MYPFNTHVVTDDSDRFADCGIEVVEHFGAMDRLRREPSPKAPYLSEYYISAMPTTMAPLSTAQG
jgi:hypothetical protein